MCDNKSFCTFRPAINVLLGTIKHIAEHLTSKDLEEKKDALGLDSNFSRRYALLITGQHFLIVINQIALSSEEIKEAINCLKEIILL